MRRNRKLRMVKPACLGPRHEARPQSSDCPCKALQCRHFESKDLTVWICKPQERFPPRDFIVDIFADFDEPQHLVEIPLRQLRNFRELWGVSNAYERI